MNKSIAAALLLTLVLANLSAYQASAQEQKPNFVRIDFTNVTLLKSVPMAAEISFANVTQFIKVNQKVNQTLDVSATFQTPDQEGPITIVLRNQLNNSTLFNAKGELTSNGAWMSPVPYDESVFRILPDDSSVTVGVGSVSGNFTMAASAATSARYLLQLKVQNTTQSVSRSGSTINIILPIHNMPPVVNFTGQVRASDNSTILATISGTFDFITGTGIDVKSNYVQPVTALNLTIQKAPSIRISRIPNTQIVRTPVQLVPLTQPADIVSFIIGKHSANLTQVTTTSTSSSNKTAIRPQSQARTLIDLEPVYAAFKNNLVAIVAIVLVLFAAVVVAKRVIG